MWVDSMLKVVFPKLIPFKGIPNSEDHTRFPFVVAFIEDICTHPSLSGGIPEAMTLE
jgi:hypothetical protein